MPVPSVVHANEIARVATASYVSQNFKIALVDSPGTDYDADDPFATIMANEVTTGLGGYARQQIGFAPADVGTFDGEKTELARKAATFTHNGAINEVIRFSHVVILSPNETDIVATIKLASRASLTDAQSAIFYFDFTLYGVFVVA